MIYPSKESRFAYHIAFSFLEQPLTSWSCAQCVRASFTLWFKDASGRTRYTIDFVRAFYMTMSLRAYAVM